MKLQQMKKTLKLNLLWISFFFIGLFLRLYHIKTNGIWNDEIFTLSIVNLDWSEFFSFFIEGKDLHPPLHYLFLKIVKLLSFDHVSETGLRIINLLPYPISALALYKFSNKKISFQFSSLITFSIISLAPNFVYITSELRQYGLLLSLTVIFTIALDEFLFLSQGKDHFLVSVLLGFLSIAISLTQYIGILILISFFIGTVIIIFSKRVINKLIKLLPAFAIYVLGMIIYSPILIKHIHKTIPYTRTIVDTLRYLYFSYGYFIFFFLFGGILVLYQLLKNINIQKILKHSKYPLLFRIREEKLNEDFSSLLLLAGIIFFLLATGINIYNGMNILTIGIVIIPVFIISLGVSTFFEFRHHLGLFLGLSLLTIFLSISLLSSTNNFDSNRVSTIDETKKAISMDHSFEPSDENNTVIIHVDWGISNKYYEEKINNIFPNTSVKTFNIANQDELSKEIRIIINTSNKKQVYLVSRFANNLTKNLECDLFFNEISPYIYSIKMKKCTP
ncbi:MAG: hypothetical protein JEZ06_00540 [Anaerolineaceae bacterium]|nr:hypothetical protein [Anaerolineaceae bacterium]